MHLNRVNTAALLALVTAAVCGAADDAVYTDDFSVRIRVASAETAIPFNAPPNTSVLTAKGAIAVPDGLSKIVLERASPPQLRYHLVAKTFLPDEAETQADYLSAIVADGFAPQVLVQGRQFQTASSKTVDNRMFLISIQHANSKTEAESLKKSLQKRSYWCYVVSEVVKPGTGTVRIEGAGSFELPITLVAETPIELVKVNTGYWKDYRTNQRYAGKLDVDIGPDGKLMLVEDVPLESYLLGVLPAEMPHEWPLETLKAQAVAARSEVLASVAGKHVLDGYDFCGTEHCRAYLGSANGKPRTDRALEETRGRFLVHHDRIVATVFSATCGGWTEDNDAVWSGRPMPALRGVSDSPNGAAQSSPRDLGVWKWLDQKSDAYCSADDNSFRWRKSFTAAELTAIVSKVQNLGRIQSIEMGERGVSGRLKSIKLVGTSRTHTVEKELPIRQIFGGLPSALFVVSTSKNAAGETVFTFIGAGRGHGVGLCQNGARGMAAAGLLCDEILTHYFSGVAIERFQ